MPSKKTFRRWKKKGYKYMRRKSAYKKASTRSYATTVQRDYFSKDVRRLTLAQNYSISYYQLSKGCLIFPHYYDAHYFPQYNDAQ